MEIGLLIFSQYMDSIGAVYYTANELGYNSMETGLQAGQRKNCDSISSRARGFSLLQNFQTSSGVHSTSCSLMGRSGSSPQDKATGK